MKNNQNSQSKKKYLKLSIINFLEVIPLLKKKNSNIKVNQMIKNKTPN